MMRRALGKHNQARSDTATPPQGRCGPLPVCLLCQETHYGRFEKWAVNKVPIGRYMAFVGSLLLAMLFIADWLLPMGPTQSVTSGEANKPTIRIKSDQDHKWPERIAFDTSAPTIVVRIRRSLRTHRLPTPSEKPL